MASSIKKTTTNIESSRFLKDVARALGMSEKDFVSYDHCQTREELEFVLYGELLQEGKAPELAGELAREMANDLWNNR